MKMTRMVLKWLIACESETQSFYGAMHLKAEVHTSIPLLLGAIVLIGMKYEL